MDSSYLFELASCYRAVGLRVEAENCYNQIIDSDATNFEARMQLAEIRRGSLSVQPGDTGGLQGASSKTHRVRRRIGEGDAKRSKRTTSLQSLDKLTLLTHGSMRKATKTFGMTREREEEGEEEIHSLFHHRQSLAEKSRNEDEDHKSEWVSVTKSLLESFRNNKVFYPVDRHHRFYGYSKEARLMSSRPKHELDAMVGRSESILGTELKDLIRTLTQLISRFRNAKW